MARYVCETCNRKGDYLEFGLCKQDHPDSVRPIIGHEEGQDIILSMTGKEIKFKDIDANYLNRFICFNAKIMQTSDIANYDIQKTFNCSKCGASKVIECNEFRDIFDKDFFQCTECEQAQMFIDKTQTIVGNLRKVVLQETIEEGDINPRRIEAHLTSKNVFEVKPGKDYRFEARLWSISMGKKGENYNRYVLDIKGLRCLDEDTDILPTPNEIEFLRNIEPKKIIESLAPQIMYRTSEKLASIISFLSGGRVDGIRGDLSCLYVGDPSVGKSDILNALHSLDKKSFKISGRSTSAAGMVMGVDNLPDGTRMATFGPVVQAHGHFVCIDEGDKMRADDMSMLHDVMEDEIAHLNKVGINMSVPAQTKIIMAANPKGSKYDEDATIMANIGMPDSFLARFGYIFLVLDDFTPEMERAKIQRINFIKVNGMERFVENEGLLSHENLMKYLNYAKRITPSYTSEALAKLEDLYIELKYRKQEKGALAIDTRAYYDVIRASYSFARFRLSQKVEICDINMAWRLYMESLKSFKMNTQGEFKDTQLASRDSTRQQFIDETLKECSLNGMINIDSLKLKLMERPKMFRTLGETECTIKELGDEGRLLATGVKGVYKYNG